MRIAIPKEITEAEHRVALVPQLVPALAQLGCTILLERGAGENAFFPDLQYQGVEFIDNPATLYKEADIVLKIEAPFEKEIAHLKANSLLVGMLSPHRYLDRIKALKEKQVTSFAMEFIPRISRAQSMDALSSQATIAGYKAVLIAANLSNRIYPMLTTAAGTLRPANVLIIGAGVAGLQAIATARRLGAIVKAYDIRAAAREQVESLGAKMVHIDIQAESTGGYARELSEQEKQKQADALKDAIAKADVVVSTALIPGKSAPKIITKDMVDAMSAGAVIVDCAASAGGNCELTQADKTILYQGIQIAGPTNLPSMVAKDASLMYAKNLISFLGLFVKEGKINLDWNDEILAQSVITHSGEIKNQQILTLAEGKS